MLNFMSMNRFFSVLPKFVFAGACLVALMLCACEQKVEEIVDYTLVCYNDVWPMDEIRIDENPNDDIKALVKRID